MALDMKYFVLKPAGEGNYAEASRRAMVAYARSIRPVDKALANELLAWVEREEEKNRIKYNDWKREEERKSNLF